MGTRFGAPDAMVVGIQVGEYTDPLLDGCRIVKEGGIVEARHHWKFLTLGVAYGPTGDVSVGGRETPRFGRWGLGAKSNALIRHLALVVWAP
jgi:hypothetical protein